MTDGPAIPAAIRRRYARWSFTKAYHYLPDAVTWRLEPAAGAQVHFLKLVPAARYPILAAEAERAAWARRYLPVPEIVESGRDDSVGWLVSVGLPGRDASAAELRADPERRIDLLAAGLRRWHALPPAECPFEMVVPAAPAPEDRVVCHGDYCLPNVLVDNGAVSGFVDLGRLGVADRWWDLAAATKSITMNLGSGWEDRFLASYGVRRDTRRLAFYRRLYDLG